MRILLSAVVGVVASVAVVADQPLLVLNLPAEGALSATVKAAYTTLQPDYDIWWLKVHEPASRDRDPAVIVTGSGSPLLKEIKGGLEEYVRKGGGLVYIASPAQSQLDANNTSLEPFGVRMASLEGKKQTAKMLPHAVTQDVRDLPGLTLRYGFMSESIEPIIMHNGTPVAMAGMVGTGRVVVLSNPLLVVPNEAEAPGSPQERLLAQAVTWAASHGAAAPGAPMGAGEAATGAPVAASFEAKIVADLPETPAWSDIATAAEAQLATLNMASERVQYEKGKPGLVAPVQARPGLLVIGSYREFEEAEAIAVSEYVDAGGSLLVLAWSERGDVKPIAALNKLLGEFAISFVLGRPGGPGVVKPHPITGGLGQPGPVGPGGSVWAFADWPLVVVDEFAVATAHECGLGRIVIVDASTLVAPKEKQPDARAWFGKLLGNAARWLTGR